MRMFCIKAAGNEVHGDHLLVRTGGGDHGAVEHGGAVALPQAPDVDVLVVHDGDPGDPLHHVAGVGSDHPEHLLSPDGIALTVGAVLPFHQQGGFGGLVGLGHHRDLAQAHAAFRIQGHVLEGRLTHGHLDSEDDLGDVTLLLDLQLVGSGGDVHMEDAVQIRNRLTGLGTGSDRHPVEKGSVGQVDHEARKGADVGHVAGLGGFALRRGQRSELGKRQRGHQAERPRCRQALTFGLHAHLSLSVGPNPGWSLVWICKGNY